MKRASTIRREAEGRGNAGAVESGQNQTQVLPVSHHPLKIPQNRRDSHISTAPACTAWKSGKQKTGFPLDQAAPATRDCELRDQRKEVGRHAASSFSCPDFMLIFQLENAPRGSAPRVRAWGRFPHMCKCSTRRGTAGAAEDQRRKRRWTAAHLPLGMSARGGC